MCNAVVAIISITFTCQYLWDTMLLARATTELQKCQQDMLLLRHMIILDYQQSESKRFHEVPYGVRIGDNSYLLYTSSLKLRELYRRSARNPRHSRDEIISRQVKNIVVTDNTLQIHFKHPKCVPLVINCAFEIQRS